MSAEQEKTFESQRQMPAQDEMSFPLELSVTAPYDAEQTDFASLYAAKTELQQQYDELVNSEAYINENWNRWLLLADPTTVLTEEEKREAAAAQQIIDNYILSRDIEDDWRESHIADGKNNYLMLSSLLEAKSSKMAALAEGAVSAFPLEIIPALKESQENIRAFTQITDEALKFYKGSMLQNEINVSDLSREAYPGYYITGNIATNLAMLALGSEALGAMGIVSSTAKSAILFGTSSALQSASDQDWSEPGQAVANVVLDTGVGILSGYVGGKAAELAISKVGLILANSNLSVDAINLLLAGTGGFSFGVAQTGTLEASKLLEAGAKGEEYQFDAAGAAINITLSTLFATLEVLKSKYLTDPAEYKLASEIEYSLQNGEMDGVEKAVDFINKKAETIDLKTIENSNAALAGGKDEGYNGNISASDDAIYKDWYGDEAYFSATGVGDSRVLWSGGKNTMAVAADFATKNGFKTLEQTVTGKLLTVCQNVANRIVGEENAYQLLSPLWDKASARFVRGADGVIHAFLNSQGISDTSVFMRIEYEIAKERSLKMIFHLVK